MRRDYCIVKDEREVRRIMSSAESSDVGLQLDEHHLPESNGSISVFRRCGARTDNPIGLHHAPHESQLQRSSEWLIAQLRRGEIEAAIERRARNVRNGDQHAFSSWRST
jgi:hypothetical protein